ncbi:MAG: hypothetical protein WD872_12135 [Pirellulaceae bacterium]
MEHLASAVVEAFAFLELSDDESVNEDDACRIMESITAELLHCTSAERAALEKAARGEYAKQKAAHASDETLKFYATFPACIFDED